MSGVTPEVQQAAELLALRAVKPLAQRITALERRVAVLEERERERNPVQRMRRWLGALFTRRAAT